MPYSVAQIRKTANDILRESGIDQPFVDVYKIAEKLGAKIVEEDFDDDMSGLLLISDGIPTIAVNKKHSEVRMRFTIAHELGHLVLHRHEDDDEENIFVDKKIFNRNAAASQGVYRQEIEANRFAAELLMPKQMLNRVIAKLSDEIDLSDDDVIGELAGEFKVSSQALAIRLSSLNIIPAI